MRVSKWAGPEGFAVSVPTVLRLDEVDETEIAAVGGKGAQLGALSRIEGLQVPDGFCVTTEAFRQVIADAPGLDERLDELSRLSLTDREAISAVSAELRRAIATAAIPDDLASAISDAVNQFGERAAYAVRSSATAEDLPTASFAGQQDTYLNVAGLAPILEHIRRCWASLFTERAVTYRRRTGIDHRTVQMAVVVQRMVFAQAAGVLFTADPVTGNRRVATVEAGYGLGEALVSGLMDPDVYTVRDGAVVAKVIGSKQVAVHAAPAGGTQQRPVAEERQDEPVLSDAQVLQLVELGRRIEASFGRPQDIEWCLADGAFQIVQSRPITTLFPIPEATDDANHVYVSVGHGQMMTDPMKPLGVSMWQLTAGAPMHEAGGRLFVDVTQRLASPKTQAGLLEVMGKGDPLIGDALQTIVDRGDFLPAVSEDGPNGPVPGTTPATIETDPEIVTELIARSEASVASLEHDIRGRSGTALLDFIRADVQELKRMLTDRQSSQVIMAGMQATWWLNERLEEWLGEKNAADTLTLSAPGNVTAEMGLALLDVADVIRPHPDVVAFLQDFEDAGYNDRGFLAQLPALAGGSLARDALQAWLDKYGMRCVGEIDITRPRWSERPAALIPALLGNIKNFEAGAGPRRFQQGEQRARAKEQDVLGRLRVLPDGERKAEEANRMIDRVRAFAGYREYPKYAMIRRYFSYKQALLAEAARLVQSRVLRDIEDVYYLRFDEFEAAVRTHRVDSQLLARRREAFKSFQALTPPRVLTSDGEALHGAYRRDDVPTGALVGLPVSAGVVEGRARVILDMAQAELEPGDILVTTATDPSWTPLFVAIAGLVTEVGGLMTHGAVIAREYGLPAVVGVLDATRMIPDGQRIRVHATGGYVEVLP